MKFAFRVPTACKRPGKYLARAVAVVVVIATVQLVPQSYAWSAPETRTHEVSLIPGQALETPFPVTHAVVSWSGEAGASVVVRSANNTDSWSTWQAVRGEVEGEESRASGIVLLRDARQLEFDVINGIAADLKAFLIDAVHGPRTLQVAENERTAEAIDGATPSPAILSRGQWGANESLRKGSPEFASVNRFVIHHTDTSNNDPNPAATVRAILAYHTQGNGWNDIGYNFLVDQQGRIYEGRYAGGPAAGENANGQGVIGAHAAGANTGSIGISMLGNFTGQRPTDAALNSVKKLIAWKGDKANIDLSAGASVVGHRDVGQTACPGNVAWNLIGEMRTDANALKTISYPAGNTPGYWIAAADGRVAPYGSARDHGSMAGAPLNGPIISMSRTAGGGGYWLMGTDGGIFSFGDARFHGSMGGTRLNQPVVGLAPTPSGNGYWLVARDGGIFAFGDAQFYGSMGGARLNQPVVGMAATPSGKGYWMVASDGGIFAFGDAQFYGSTGNIRLAQPIVSMAPAPNGAGYWLVARDGGVFAYNTRFMGSVPMLKVAYGGTASAAATSTGLGYYMLAEDGGLYTFGDARFHGAATGTMRGVAIALAP